MEMNFLQYFFHALKMRDLKYSVLRNYQQLPFSTGGSDLDILINKKSAFEFYAVLKDTCEKYNGEIISHIDSENCPRICIMGSKNNGWGLLIDLHYDSIFYRGYEILSSKMIWENTFLFKNEIYALNLRSDALVGLFKELLNNQKCTPRIYNQFRELSLDSKFIDALFLDLGKPELGTFLLKYKSIKYSEKVIEQIVEKLNLEFPKKMSSYTGFIGKLKRLFRQPGFTIAFLGVDGAGKSTIINNIKPVLIDAFHGAVYYEHMRPNKIPSIARLLGGDEEFNGPVTKPHDSLPSGLIISMFRWGYYLIDYTLGYFLKVFPKKSIRSCVWIFDRYYYDYLIDPKRGRIKLPKFILKIGQFIIPEPDLILCLGADAQTIYERKPELPISEVERQVKELKSFCKSHKRAYWIDTNKSIEISSQDTLMAIIKRMESRFKYVKPLN